MSLNAETSKNVSIQNAYTGRRGLVVVGFTSNIRINRSNSYLLRCVRCLDVYFNAGYSLNTRIKDVDLPYSSALAQGRRQGELWERPPL